MTLSRVTLFVLFLSGCDHSETKTFERDREITSSENSIPVRADFDNSSAAEDIKTFSKKDSDGDVHREENVLEMETQDGVRYVWVEINGIKLRFIFDTEASSICISSAEANVLYRQGTLRKEDILDVEYFQDATGRISEGTKINLRTVKVGSTTFENIEATIVDNVNAPLLLGQTVLEGFGKIVIDNENSQIIFK